MLKKSDLKVIRGGALSPAEPDEAFEAAYATDTRLMGVLVVYVRWKLTGLAASGKPSRTLHQFFYVETTEDGIESYRGIYGMDSEELRQTEQSMLGGLGAGRVPLELDEALYLVQSYAELTRELGNPLPDGMDEYGFVLRREVSLSDEREKELFRKLCGELDSANQLVNYFVMRYFSKDFYAVRQLASADIDCGQVPDPSAATLCRNEIKPPQQDGGQDGEEPQEEGLYVCESVIEDDRGHRIVVSEVGVVREGGRLAVSSFEVASMFSISFIEAAMKLARPEYVTLYELVGPPVRVRQALDERYVGALQNITEGGKLYIVFKDDNLHMGKDVYQLNDDVKEILYMTAEDQLIAGAYTLSGIRRLEDRLHRSRISRQLVEVARYEFKEPILYDYTMGYGGDFLDYVEELMGFEDEE